MTSDQLAVRWIVVANLAGFVSRCCARKKTRRTTDGLTLFGLVLRLVTHSVRAVTLKQTPQHVLRVRVLGQIEPLVQVRSPRSLGHFPSVTTRGSVSCRRWTTGANGLPPFVGTQRRSS